MPSQEDLEQAAQLCVFYSVKSPAGSYEVDYTRRKHVKRIPKSQQVQYHFAKTLRIDAKPQLARSLILR